MNHRVHILLSQTAIGCLLVFIATQTGLAAAAPLRVTTPSVELRRTLNLAPSYTKVVLVDSFPVVGSAKVADEALLEAGFLIRQMLGGRDDILAALTRNKVRFAVMAHDEFTTDIPEHSDLQPKMYWDKRARGLGASPARPTVSCGAENLLCYPGDPYAAENILVHEFGHAIHEMGLRDVDPTFDRRLQATYEQAMQAGLWKGKYAASNRMEYWAEGVQSWFDTNRFNDFEHNHVHTRVQLKEYDPALGKLLAEIFGDGPWRYQKPADRKPPSPHLATYDSTNAPKFAWPEKLVTWYARFRRGEESMAPPEAVALAPLAPGAQSDWRSAKTGAKTMLYFLNASKQTLRLEWIDFDGKPQPYGLMRPGDHSEHETFVGHVWRVTDAATNALAIYIAGRTPGNVVLTNAPAR